MKSFSLLPAEERALYWRNYANRTKATRTHKLSHVVEASAIGDRRYKIQWANCGEAPTPTPAGLAAWATKSGP